MANTAVVNIFGPKKTGCVMQGLGGARSFCDTVPISAGGTVEKLLVYPTPDRSILRVTEMIDGIATNNRNAVRRNQLHWIASHILEKFPNRKFKGLRRCITQIESEDGQKEEVLNAMMQAIQRVVRYGGTYKTFTEGLFAVWDGAATISDSAADIGVTPQQWSSLITIQNQIREKNQKHNVELNGETFRMHYSRSKREEVILKHKKELHGLKPLLLRLMTLTASDINPELNADLCDFLHENECGKRLARRIKRAYYNALARNYLLTCDVDPLTIKGEAADKILLNLKKVAYSEIGELKIGNKIYRVDYYDHINSEDAVL